MSLKTQLQANNAELQNHLADIMKLPDVSDLKNGAYVWKKFTAQGGDFVSYVPDNDPDKYPNGGIGYDGFYYELYGQPVKIVTWADGTDEEIVEMVAAADRGEINLSDYWAVGQERKVTTKSIGAGAVDETQKSQEVTLVLMNNGGKELSTAVESGRTECSFIVGLKNCLKTAGRMNLTDTNVGGWKSCKRRTWCNNTFKNAIPSTLLPIFKKFKNLSGKGNGITEGTDETIDLFALPAEIEVFGTNRLSVSGEGTQFQWYKTAANRKKKVGDSGSIQPYWWERSPYTQYSESFCGVMGSDGSSTAIGAINPHGISPFGCI